MSNRIELEYPYTTKWLSGYTVINRENRKHVLLISEDGSRSSTSYARYLMSVYLGRFLNEDEYVDHIDDDKTNDVIENLQILTFLENSRKEANRRGRLMAEIKCPVCGSIFTRRKGLTQALESLKGKVTCCSKACSSSFKRMNLTKEERDKISEESLLRVFREH